MLSKKIVDILYKQNMIEVEDLEVYEYATERLILKVTHIFCVLFIGFILNCLIETLIFVTVFSILRSYVEGYHAKTKLKCIVISIGMALSEFALVKYFGNTINNQWILILFLTVSIIYILLLRKTQFFSKGILWVLLCCGLLMLFLYFDLPSFSLSVIYPFFLVDGLTILRVLIN